MDPTAIKSLFELFGVDLATYAALSGTVYLVLELLKGKFPDFIKGRVTDIAAVLIAFGLAWATVKPQTGNQWLGVAFLTVACWLVPAGIHKMRRSVHEPGTRANPSTRQ